MANGERENLGGRLSYIEQAFKDQGMLFSGCDWCKVNNVRLNIENLLHRPLHGTFIVIQSLTPNYRLLPKLHFGRSMTYNIALFLIHQHVNTDLLPLQIRNDFEHACILSCIHRRAQLGLGGYSCVIYPSLTDRPYDPYDYRHSWTAPFGAHSLPSAKARFGTGQTTIIFQGAVGSSKTSHLPLI
jgi:hypothetical protein